MMERRFIQAATSKIQLVEREDGPPGLVGYASVFFREGDAGTEFELWRDTFERILPGAFDDTLKRGDDVMGLFNHDPSGILGRLSAKTLTLSVDARGLRYELQPGDTSVARDVIENVRLEHLTGSSFSFNITDEEWRKVDGKEIREITGVQLFDVGPVTFPAYEGTTTGVRATWPANLVGSGLDEARASRNKWKAAFEGGILRRSREIDLDAAQVGL